MKIVLVAVPLINSGMPPLSVALLAGYLKQNNFDVKTFDFNIEAYDQVDTDLKEYWKYYKGFQWHDTDHFRSKIRPRIIDRFMSDWCDRILEERPEILGISLTVSPAGQILAEEIRRRRPDIKIVFGGPVCSEFAQGAYLTRESCRSENELSGINKSFYPDASVSGEGEETFLKLVQDFYSYGHFVPIKGAAIYVNGKPQYLGTRAGIADLDKLAPPDYDDLDLSLYRDADNEVDFMLPMYTSRGCTARCNFCLDYKMWLTYRQKSPKVIADEIAFLGNRYNVNKFHFVELILNGHHKKLEEFAKSLISKKLDFSFTSHARVDPRLTQSLLDLLKEAGLFHLIYGVESGSTKVLKKMRKGYNPNVAVDCIRRTYEAKIAMSINIIVGFPGENTIDFFKTILLIWKIRKYIAHSPGISDCAASPGTDIFLNPEKFDVILDKSDPNCFSSWKTKKGFNTYRIRILRKYLLIEFCKYLDFNHKKKNSINERIIGYFHFIYNIIQSLKIITLRTVRAKL